MSNCSNSDNDFCCKLDPIQLALIGSFITVVGDFIVFLAAFADAQKQCEKKNKNKDSEQVDSKKSYAENKIKELEYEIYKLKKEVSDLD